VADEREPIVGDPNGVEVTDTSTFSISTRRNGNS
jgi:hypothetical protein